MEEKEHEGTSIRLDRRSFLAAVAATIATAGLSGCSLGNPDQPSASTATGTALPATWDKEADVVVIGSGAGGSAAAWSALKGGLSTVILEQEELLGGSAIANAGEIALGGTALQKAAGYEITPAKYKQFLQFCGQDGVPEELLNIFIEQGPSLYDWLVSIGVKFESGVFLDHATVILNSDNTALDVAKIRSIGLMAFGNEFHPNYRAGWSDGKAVPTVHWCSADGSEEEAKYKNFGTSLNYGGPGYMLPIIRGVRDMGGQYLTATKAVHAYKDETGRVVGVKATQKDGKAINVRANKGVVIAGGNWLTDAKLAERYAGYWFYSGLAPLSKADGGMALRIGIDMGGHVANGDSCWTATKSTFGLNSWNCTRHMAQSKGIYVDQNGNRFCAEDEYSPGVTDSIVGKRLGRPTGVGKIWCILDDKHYQEMLRQWSVAAISMINKIDTNAVIHASNVNELAQKIRAPYLPQQIAMYNKYAANGQDPQFGRNPEVIVPFADGPIHAAAFVEDYMWAYSHGGLDINAHGQVLNDSGGPIPGLFAAGRSARSICEGRSDAATGMSCSSAMVMGRVIGTYLSAQ